MHSDFEIICRIKPKESDSDFSNRIVVRVRVFADAVLAKVAFRGYRFAQPPVIESLSLSGASHPISSECSLSLRIKYNRNATPIVVGIHATQMQPEVSHPMQLEVHPMSSWRITQNGEGGN